MIYKMKDLGYPRTPTTAVFRVEMGNGSQWDVPVQAIVDSRDAFYAEDKEDTVGSIRQGFIFLSEIKDWAGNEMNWSDVGEFATKASTVIIPADYQDGWCNGEKEIVGQV